MVSTTASIARWGVNMCQYTVPRVTRGYRSVHQNENSSITPTTLVFILTHNEEEPDNSHIKQFEAKEMKKIRDWKLPKEITNKKKILRFCKVKSKLFQNILKVDGIYISRVVYCGNMFRTICSFSSQTIFKFCFSYNLLANLWFFSFSLTFLVILLV